MTYQEFKNKYNGKYVDYDGAYGYQCWDLAQYYFTEVLNVPDSVLSGCNWVKNMVIWDSKYAELMKYFDEIDVHTMIPGDVCIWTGGDGHIAVFDYWDEAGQCNYFFSQDPYINKPCGIRQCKLDGIHAFRRKGSIPPAPEPKPVITPNVLRDETKDQIEVIVPELRIRTSPSLKSDILGYASEGFYNYLETKESDGYTWYRISSENWIASSDEWTKIYPKKEDEYINIKVLDKKDGYVLVDLGKVYIKE